MTRVALLRCAKLPSFVTWDVPNLEELFTEDKLLQAGFEAQGVAAESVVWSDPAVDWNRYDAALIRSTWDYLDERQNFLRVLAAIEASSCRLFNPPAAVRWNMDKGYLFDLARWGVPIIPTFAAAKSEPGALRRTLAAMGAGAAVLKPTIGLGAAYTRRVPLDELEGVLAGLSAEQPAQEYLIQPFIESVVSEGEWSFVYFNRQLSHVLLKTPAPDDFRVQGIYGGRIALAAPSSGDRLQAEAVLAALPFDVLYARLDFLRVAGRLAVIEVELIEPIFSFNLAPDSIARLVDVTRRRLDTS
jgi:glutathione synthase/RimK-type ligase-like ATP-grasp enzyme